MYNPEYLENLVKQNIHKKQMFSPFHKKQMFFFFFLLVKG